ncbi:hypothetical protein HGRIS_005988 [Hohenbuehelia grisea]|uniref:non-specific serine/threonine protein kinase n=1 Tax=Hohenbuehelia grisea TaxID=104357 RepID=A0ABR3JYF5_9AGAR
MPEPTQSSRALASSSSARSLNGYQLGDSLGKGAFGQVYRALNWATGETVAVKEIQLSNIPKAELGEIMSEIDLLKNLIHPNIVKYKGFLKTPEFLYIILEFCENGSLYGILKRFGKFPENLVAVYTAQVLDGLVYLHDQGVIHRDIKGANILTNKDGCVKLADFGVATVGGGAGLGIGAGTEGIVHDDAVVGSPYWMAPEIIEQRGATTASDIWSLGCLVIELLTGHPPYHTLSPMPALFRIVQDDCPPIPDGASNAVKDFLYACFQRDPALRVGARRLTRHPWIAGARRGKTGVAGKRDEMKVRNRPETQQRATDANAAPGNLNYDEAVLKVQEWNEALKSPSRPSKHPSNGSRSLMRPGSPTPGANDQSRLPIAVESTHIQPSTSVTSSTSTSSLEKHMNGNVGVPMNALNGNLMDRSKSSGHALAMNMSMMPLQLPPAFALQAPEEQTDNWDDDFEDLEGVSFSRLQAPDRTSLEEPRQSRRPTSPSKHGQIRSQSPLFLSSHGSTPYQSSLFATNALQAPSDDPSQALTQSQDEPEDAQTIKPSRSPGMNVIALPVSRPPRGDISVIAEDSVSDTGGSIRSRMAEDVEDYSDLGADEDEERLMAKVNNFKAKNSLRRGLIHPDDIKIFSQSHRKTSPGPLSAPLPSSSTPHISTVFSAPGSSTSSFAPPLSRKSSRPALSPLSAPHGSNSAFSSSAASPVAGPSAHGRSSSFVGAFSGSGGGKRSSSTGSGSSSLGRDGGRRARSQGQLEMGDFGKYAEDEDEDYDDVFAKVGGAAAGSSMETLQLNTRLSNKSWLGDDNDDEEDPFAEIDEGFAEDDLEANLQRDKHARLCNTVNQLIDQLTPSAPDFQLRDACDQLIDVMSETSDMQVQFVSSHGMLAILEVLEGKCSRELIMKVLQIINMLVTADLAFLESFCLIGGIPVMMGFTSKRFPSECRLQASHFIRLLCHTSVLTLQMFISCRGLKVLVDLLDEDYNEQTELVVHALNGIGSVFELQSPTTKNDFCRMFIREGLLDPLSAALLNVMGSREAPSSEMRMKIIQILLVFSQVTQSDIHVRNAMGTRKVVRRLLRACELLEPDCLVQMLKAVKHLSMNVTLLDVLQNANAIEILTRILDEQSTGPHSTEMANHIFQTCYNLCRLNKSRQEEAAQAGIIPCLRRVIETSSPLKQFALPILCDLASAGKSCRMLLWQQGGLSMYLKLLDDQYFQVSAIDAIVAWLQEEPARIEDELIKPDPVDVLLKCFVSSKANSFENLLEPFLKLLRLSSALALAFAKSGAFFTRIVDRLGHHSKAVVRLNLLRVLKAVCDVHPNRSVLVERYGLHEVVERLSKTDGAVLVRELAREIVPVLRPVLKPAHHSKGASTSSAVPRDKLSGGRTDALRGGGREGLTPKRMRRAASETSASSYDISSSHVRPAARGRLAPSTSSKGESHRQRIEDISWSGDEQSTGSSRR